MVDPGMELALPLDLEVLAPALAFRLETALVVVCRGARVGHCPILQGRGNCEP